MAKSKTPAKAKLRGLLSDPNVPVGGLLAGLGEGGARFAVERAADAVAPIMGPVGKPSLMGENEAAAIPSRRGLLPALNQAPTQAAPSRGLLGLKGAPTAGGLLGQAGNFADDFLFGGDYGRLRAERQSRDEGRAAATAHREAYAEAMGPNGFDPEAYGRGLARRGQAPDLAGIGGLEGIEDSQDVRGARGRQELRSVTSNALAPYIDGRGGVTAPSPGDADYIQNLIRSLGGPQAATYDMPTTPAGLQSAVSAGLPAGGWMDAASGWQQQGEVERSNRAGEDYRNAALAFQIKDARDRLDFDRERQEADMAYRYDRAEAEDAYRAWERSQFSRSEVEGVVLQKAITQGVASLNPAELEVYKRAVTVSQGMMGYGMMGGGTPPPGVGGPQQTAPAPAPRQAQAQGGRTSPQNPARPRSQEEVNRLPPGTYYIDAGDGELYVKE